MTNPTHLWLRYQSPAEMVKLVSGENGPMRERLRRWREIVVSTCDCLGKLTELMMDGTIQDFASRLPDYPDKCKTKHQAVSLLRCIVPAPRTCPACGGRLIMLNLSNDRYAFKYAKIGDAMIGPCGPIPIKQEPCSHCSATGIVCEPPVIDPRWLSSSVCDLVERIQGTPPCKECDEGSTYCSRGFPPDFTITPLLAEALSDAGCDDEALLSHLRDDSVHCESCYAIQALNAAR